MYNRKHQSQQRVYPEDIQCVIDPVNGKGGVFLGNIQASQNLRTLQKHGIGAVLTAAKSIILNHPKTHVPYHLHVKGQDHERFDLSVFFDQAVDFIHQTREKTNLLVHCMAGVSRSVTLLIAYLMKIKGMPYNEAFKITQINPNSGFIKQLHEYERKLTQNRKAGSSFKNQQPYSYAYTKKDQLNPETQQASYKDEQYGSTKNKLWEQAWNHKDNSYSRQPHSYYEDTLLRKRKNNHSAFNQNYRQQDNSRKLNETTNFDDYTRKSKLQSTNRSFEDLNQQLDKRIADIRQKYSDLADNTTGNNRLKDMLSGMKRPQMHHNVSQTISYKQPSLSKKPFSAAEPYSYSNDYPRSDYLRNQYSKRNDYSNVNLRGSYKRDMSYGKDYSINDNRSYGASQLGMRRSMGPNYYDY